MATYPRDCHVLPTVGDGRDRRFRERVDEAIVQQVPETSHDDSGVLCPFKYDITIQTIVAELLPFATGDTQTNAVYVLECRPSMRLSDGDRLGVSARSATRRAKELDKNCGRVVYVGVTVNLLRRLCEHLQSPADEGAYATGLCPPLRVLAVGWFSSYERAARAERLAAELLRDRFPNDLVFQS